MTDPTGLSAWTSFQQFVGLDNYQNAIAQGCSIGTIVSTGAVATGKMAIIGGGIVAIGAGGQYLITGSLAVPFASQTSKASDVIFQSEHVINHLIPEVSQATMEQAIKNDLLRNSLTGQYEIREMILEGRTLEYRAYQLPDGKISVGTYFFK